MKKIDCSYIERAPAYWSYWRDLERNLTFDKEFPDTANFCNNVLSNNSKEILIIGRIGSPSADGEVYNIRFQNTNFAMKIMPRIDPYSQERNFNEITTANRASEYPDYFPKVFAYGFCDNALYHLSDNNEISPFVPKAIEYYKYNQIFQHLKNKNLKKRFDSEYRNGESLLNLSKKYNLQFENSNRIEVDFLISELANGDLGNWMMKNRSVEEWKKILLDIMTGIYYLTVMIRKVHPDLHPGNILIVENKALIHDFGRCYDVSDENQITYKASLISFCNEFLACSIRNDLFVPREILAIIQTLSSFLSRNEITSENIKQIYEEFIFPIITY